VRYTAEMRRLARPLGTLLIVAGVLALAWVVVVWRWQDPVTALYTHWKQHQLAQSVDREFTAYRPVRFDRSDLAAERRATATEADRFRLDAKRGQAIGRIVIGRIELRMVIVNGTDHESLKQGLAATFAASCRARTGSSTSRDTGPRTSHRSRTSRRSAGAT
jgi:sortase (surface protein transpeptidase)